METDDPGTIELDGRRPVRTKMAPPLFYASLDEGIRFAVRLLHANGIETGQSCEGGDGHSYEKPTIDLWGQPVENATAFHAVHVLHTYGLPVDGVELRWRIHHGMPLEPLWRITLAEPCRSRANEKPMLWGYQFADEPAAEPAAPPAAFGTEPVDGGAQGPG